MEKRSPADPSKQWEMEQLKTKLSGRRNCATKTRSGLESMAYGWDGKCM